MKARSSYSFHPVLAHNLGGIEQRTSVSFEEDSFQSNLQGLEAAEITATRRINSVNLGMEESYSASAVASVFVP